MAEVSSYTVADYSARIAMLRQAVAEQFPERAGTIYIVDQTQDPLKEVERAGKALGVPDLAEQLSSHGNENVAYPRISGLSIPVHTPDGRTVYMAYGRGYLRNLDQRAPSDSIAESEMRELTHVAIHEVGHALQIGAADSRNPSDSDRYHESFGELFTLDVSVRHGLIRLADADNVVAGYDARHVTQAGTYDPYDPGLAYHEVRADLAGKHAPYDPAGFHGFDHLRESFERSRAALDKAFDSPQRTMDRTDISFVQSRMMRELKMEGESDDEIKNWIMARPDIFPEAARAHYAERWLSAVAPMEKEYEARHVPVEKQDYPAYNAPEPAPDLARSAAQAWLRQAPNDNKADDQLADQLLSHLALQEGRLAALLPAIKSHRENTEWAQKLLAGVPLPEALAGITVDGRDIAPGTAVSPAPAPAQTRPPHEQAVPPR